MFSFRSKAKKDDHRAADVAAAGGVGLWEWDAGAGRFWFSDHARELLQLKNSPSTVVEIQKRIFSDDQAKFLHAFTHSTADKPIEMTLRLELRPEYYRWLRWRGRLQTIGGDARMVGTIQDVHEERLIQLELEFTQEMLNEAQRIARLGSWQYDIVAKHLFWSEETFYIFGRDPALGAPQGDMQSRYFNADDFAAWRARAESAIRAGHAYQSDLRAMRDDGHNIMVRIMGRPLFDKGGNPYLVVGTIQDITDWVDMQRAQARAVENQQTQSQFLASVSHEIRTPMNAIFGMAQLLLRANLPPQQMEQARVVLSAAQDLLALINDLLDMAKVEAGHMTLENISFDLLEMLREVTVLHAGKIFSKDLEFVVDLDAQLPRMVEGDALRLKQIIGNLLSNAAKFTKQGQITLKVSAEGQAGAQQIIRFAVQDTGIGIPPHKLESVFQKYVQAEASTAREYGGTGLGLSICRELVQLMGGEIYVTSDTHGTRFWFDVPLHQIKADPLPPLRARVLLLEPAAVAAQNISAQLQSLQAEVVPVSRAEELFTALADVGGVPFTHILLAEHPSYDSNQLATRIRETASQQLKIILLSLPITQTVTSPAFNAIMLKPALPHELRRVLAGLPVENSALPKTNLKILLAEDNRASQTALVRAFTELGCQVTAVDHGQDAVATAQKDRFDLIFMDVQMPMMDGLSATRALCAFWEQQNQPQIPIIGLTGNVGAQDRASCIAAGMKDVITKPVMLDNLRAALERYAHHAT